jgi:hypothetical protein
MWIIGKNIYQTTFYFAEEDTGHGSEDIKKECNKYCITCFDIYSFLAGFHNKV